MLTLLFSSEWRVKNCLYLLRGANKANECPLVYLYPLFACQMLPTFNELRQRQRGYQRWILSLVETNRTSKIRIHRVAFDDRLESYIATPQLTFQVAATTSRVNCFALQNLLL